MFPPQPPTNDPLGMLTPPMAQPQTPKPVIAAQDPKQQLLAIATIGAMLGAGPKSGLATGLGHGVLQGQQELQRLSDLHSQQSFRNEQILQEAARRQADDAADRQRQLQQAVLTISQRVKDLPDKASYDVEIGGYAKALQGAGYRLDENWLRQAAPYVAPTAEKRAQKAMDAFSKNPANAELFKSHPDQLSKVMVSFDVDGDGVPEQVPLMRVASIAQMPFAQDASGGLMTYPKGTTLDEKASADGIFQTLIAKARAEGKNPDDPTVRLGLQEQANQIATSAKAKETDPEIDTLRKDILRLQADKLRQGTQPASAVDLSPTGPYYRYAQDLAFGRLTLSQLQRQISARGGSGQNANAIKAAIYDEAVKLNPDFNPAQFEMGYKFASNPKTMNQMASINNVLSGVPDLLKSSDAAKRMGATILNNAVMRGGIAFGGKSYSNFNTARIAFADELSGALGYGSATDMSREMGFNMTDPNLSPDNFRSAMEEVVVPFVNRKRASLLGQMGPYSENRKDDTGTGDPALDAAVAKLRNRRAK